MYEFGEQLAREEVARLDGHFKERFLFQEVTMTEQKLGMDRIFVNEKGCRFSVEYKADHKGCKTGNAFIETMSQDKNNVLGWGLTSGGRIPLVFGESSQTRLHQSTRSRRRIGRASRLIA